jgi:hypothetical protein
VQVLEKNGGYDGTRTRDLCRDRVGTSSTSSNLQGCLGLPSTCKYPLNEHISGWTSG